MGEVTPSSLVPAPIEINGYSVVIDHHNIVQGGTAVEVCVCYNGKILFSYEKAHVDYFHIYVEYNQNWPFWVKALWDSFNEEYDKWLDTE